jgi:hypothetical protein
VGINPVVAVDDNGTVYAVCLDGSTSPYTSELESSISTDHGVTFGAWAIAVPPPMNGTTYTGIVDRPGLTAFGQGHVYMSFTELDFTNDAANDFLDHVSVVSSTDGGTSWSAPTVLSTDRQGHATTAAANWGPCGSAITSDANGHVYVSWANYQGPVFMTKSTDGTSFATPTQVADENLIPPVTGIVVDSTGMNVALVWSLAHEMDGNVRVAASKDGGTTWSTPTELAAQGVLGTVAIDPTGGIDLLWTSLDSQANGSATVTTRYASSPDWLATAPTPHVLASNVINPYAAGTFEKHLGAQQGLSAASSTTMEAIYLGWRADQSGILYRKQIPAGPMNGLQ